MLGYKRIKINNLGKVFYYNEVLINRLKKDLDKFLSDKPYMRKKMFAARMILSLEVKTNNAIEGDIDDFSKIEDAINNIKGRTEKEQRIINLYKAYQYILNGNPITKESLYELYQILSKDLLDEFSINNMNGNYRGRDVYILKSSDTLDCDRGLNPNKLDIAMEELLRYINNNDKLDETDEFIKSQIIHYLFVYIHPYFDVNGRCSRTLSMWYLLNNDNYPYVIFNRGLSLSKGEYIKSIRKSRNGNLTSFLSYILKTVHLELEKEYVIMHSIRNIKSFTPSQLEILEYILTLDEPTLDRLYNLYLFYNQYIKKEEFIDSKITPFIKLGVINIDKLNNRISINRQSLKIPSYKVKQLKYVKI